VDQLDPLDLEFKIKTSKILNVGCGNSTMCEDMYDQDGFRGVQNIDLSPEVIQLMMSRNHDPRQHLKFHVMDVRELKYPNDYFDAIIDKGTLDCLLCGSYAWKNFLLALKEISRVMKNGAYFISLSHGKPADREKQFKRECFNWELKTFEVQTESYALDEPVYAYVLKKVEGADIVMSQNWGQVNMEITGEEIEPPGPINIARTNEMGQTFTKDLISA
jgi:ubiquinone/menaquinone biosynthesis C-methylase UbiE